LTFIDELLESGGHFIIERTDEGASIGPAGTRDADLESFQQLVRRVRANAGNGYGIQVERLASDRPGCPVDLLVVSLDNDALGRNRAGEL